MLIKVLGQQHWLLIYLATYFTGQRIDASMRHHMHRQIIFPGETLKLNV